MKNVLVNGCSFSRGPDSWPYFLKNANIINLAQSGAGNTYIFETTIAELSNRKYDYVLIMWSGVERVDYKVSDIKMFGNSWSTSQAQHLRNDWSEKIIIPINDQDYVEKDWVFGTGHFSDPAVTQSKIFEGVYKYVDRQQFRYHLLIKMIALQNTLKQLNIPYMYSFFMDYEHELKKIPELYNMLDQSCIYNKENINTIAKTNSWYYDDGMHPNKLAHKTWANLINNHLGF